MKKTLPGLRSPVNRFSKINLLSKDQGLLSRTSTMSSSLIKIAKYIYIYIYIFIYLLFPTSLIVTSCNPRQSFWTVDLNASLLNSLLVCNLNRILNFACCFDEFDTSWELTAKTPFSSSERLNFLHISSIAASIDNDKCIKERKEGK